MNTPLTQNIVWLGMCLQVPADWEMVRHGTDPDQGSLVMVDRRHQRLQLNWRKLDRRPDLEQMIEDYRRGDLAEHQGVKHKRISGAGGWHALRRSRADQHLTRAVRFDEADRRLVELALPWPHGPQGDLELELLQSFRLEAPNQQGLRWCAWGMRVEVPQGWKLHSAGIEPGSTHMRFTQGRAESLVRRLGAVDTWFHGHLDEFLTQQVSDRSISPRVTEVNKHPACEMETIEPGTRWQRWTGRLRARHDLAWLCPSDHAVYHVMTLAAQSQSNGGVRDFAVTCCQPPHSS